MTTCPGRETLLGYERGELADALAEKVDRHLPDCGLCRAAMEEIRRADPFIDRLRHVFGESTQASSQWVIPDYERIQLCGEGAYGTVWAVRDRVGVCRALKVIDLDRVGPSRTGHREKVALETYCRKIDRHPYLIAIGHVGLAAGGRLAAGDRLAAGGTPGSLLYYTMELADDQGSRTVVRETLPPNYRPLTLETIVRRGPLSVDVALEVSRRLLRGLAKLHSLDLVHRDIKPSNVIFVGRQPKLADIGLVTAEAEAGVAIGTPQYMPPDRRMDKTGDTYAMGKVIHEMIVGRPLDGEHRLTPYSPPQAVVAARRNGHRPAQWSQPHAVVPPGFPALPEGLDWGSSRWTLSRVNEVLIRACAERASERYATAAEMLEDLEACLDLQLGSLLDELEVDRGPNASSGSRPSRFSLLSAIGRQFSELQPEGTRRPRSETTLVALACIRTIPWLLGFIVVMAVISRL